MIGDILHLCLPSLYAMIVRILDVIVTFMQQFATTNYVTYLLSCHNWVIKLVRGPVGQTQTGPRTSWLVRGPVRFAKRKLVRGPGSGFLDTAVSAAFSEIFDIPSSEENGHG